MEEPLSLGEQHFAPVFTPSVLGNISRSPTSVAAHRSTGLHNLMSQAVAFAPACKGQYPLTIFAPDVGGQRQAYTQVASELASKGYLVLTVDSPYLSGVVEHQSDDDVTFGLVGKVIGEDDAFVIQSHDLDLVRSQATWIEESLQHLPFWNRDITLQPGQCMFGHGSAGQIAQLMVQDHTVKCGGPLEGILTLPAPFNPDPTAPEPPAKEPSSPVPPSSPYGKRPTKILSATLEILKTIVEKVQGGISGILEPAICKLGGTCETRKRSDPVSIQARNAVDDPWYYPKGPCGKYPCYDYDYSYRDDKDEYGPGYYNDKWDHDCEDHYEDDYDYNDRCGGHYDPPYYPPILFPPQPYPPKPYPPKPYPPQPYPSKPYPPPGIFPPNMTWPPYSDGLIPNLPWDDHWDDYRNDGGDIAPGYGHSPYYHHDGGYPEGYPGGHAGGHEDYPGGYPGDHGKDQDWHGVPDHYPIPDWKKPCQDWFNHHENECEYEDDHGYFGGHGEDNCEDDCEDDYEDDDEDCENDYEDDYDDDYDEDCEDDYEENDYEDHHHGHVDDHYDDEGHDNGYDHGEQDDHGYVDEHYDDEGDDYGYDPGEHDDHGYVDDWHD
jgi:hypothetical protein